MNQNFLKYPKKIFDTSRIPDMGRVDVAWKGKVLSNAFGKSRKGPSLPASFKFYEPKGVLEYFNLQAVEFGNWLNQEDRYTYLVGSSVSLFDLAQITGLNHKQIGFAGKLSLAHGARGRNSALAHFEPSRFAINITRYKRQDSPKGSTKYFTSGGSGSIGHEWAHALDFYLGRYVEKNMAINFLSHALNPKQSRKVGQIQYYTIGTAKDPITQTMIELLQAICYDKVPGTTNEFKVNKFYGGLIKLNKDGKLGDYWIRIHEVFARSFEVFLFYESGLKKIDNPYLRKQKYESFVYPSKVLYTKFAPKFRKLFSISKRAIPLSAQAKLEL